MSASTLASALAALIPGAPRVPTPPPPEHLAPAVLRAAAEHKMLRGRGRGRLSRSWSARRSNPPPPPMLSRRAR